MEHHFPIRTKRSLKVICDQLNAALGLPAFAIQDNEARVNARGVDVRLTHRPIDPRRERVGNLVAILSSTDLRLHERWLNALKRLHEPVEYRFEDSFYIHSSLTLTDFCARLSARKPLAAFEFDGENENEWAYAEDEASLIHLSRAYADETYHKWNPKRCPEGCNYWIELQVKTSARETWNSDWHDSIWIPQWITDLKALGDGRVASGGRWLPD